MAKPRIEIELTTKGASAVQKALGGVLSSVRSWVTGLGAIMSASLSVRELTRGIQEAVNTLDNVGAAAQKAGVATKELSTLGYAATISKANVEQLEVGLKFLNRSIFEAASGAKETSDTYNTLGISVRNSDGTLRSANEILLDLADRFVAMPNGAQKTATALQLLGRSGSELIPFLNNGSAAIRQLQEEARVFGLEVTPQAAQAAGDFNDNLQRLGYAAKGMFQTLAAELLPSLVALTNRMVALVKASEALGVVGRMLSAVLRELAWFLVAAAEAVKVLAAAFDILTDYLSVPLFALGRFAGALSDLGGLVASSVGEMLRGFQALGTVMELVLARNFVAAALVAKDALKDLTVSTARMTADVAVGVARVGDAVVEVGEFALEVDQRAKQKWADAVAGFGGNLLKFDLDVANPPAPPRGVTAFEPAEFDSATVTRQKTKLELEAQAQTLADKRLAISTQIARLENDRWATDTERYRRSLDLKREELALVEEHVRKLKERLELEQDDQTRQLLTQQIRQGEREQAGLGTGIEEQESLGDPASIRDQLFVAADDMARRIGTLAQQIARSFTSVVGSAIDGIADSMAGLIQGTMDWADALRNVAQTMSTAVVNAISRMFAEWLIGRAMMAMKNILFSAKEGAADTAAKAPGALMASISSYGIAAIVGTVALIAAIAAISGAFAQGGLVRGPGGPKEDRVLARLSSGEFVIPAERVSQYGTEFFERIRQGRDVVHQTIAEAFLGGQEPGSAQGSHSDARLETREAGVSRFLGLPIRFKAGQPTVLPSAAHAGSQGSSDAGLLATIAAFAQGGLVRSIAAEGMAFAQTGLARAVKASAYARGGLVRALAGGQASAPTGPKPDGLLARLASGEIQFNAEGLRHYGEPALQAMNARLDPLTGETAALGAATAGSRDVAATAAPTDPAKMNLSLVLVDSRNQARQFLESAEGEARLVQIVRKHRMQVGIPT